MADPIPTSLSSVAQVTPLSLGYKIPVFNGSRTGWTDLTALQALIGGSGGGGTGESVWDSPEAHGAIGDGTTDDTAALNDWLQDTTTPLKAAFGTYAIKGSDGASAALDLSADGVIVFGGTFVCIANGSGHAPGISLLVSGDNCIVEGMEFRNSGDLGKATSDGGNEYPMDGIRLQGAGNVARSCRAWHFVTPFRIQGSGVNASNCHFDTCFGTVKDVSNLAYSNDGLLATYADNCSFKGCHVGVSTGASSRAITYESVTGADSSTLRCGVTVDAACENIQIINCVFGEGFVVGIDGEGTGDRRVIVQGCTVYSQQRNAVSPAGGLWMILDNWLLAPFNTEASSTTGTIGGATENTIIRSNFIYGNSTSIDAIKCLASQNDVIVEGNQFRGSFKSLVTGVCDRWIISNNILNGTAVRGVDVDRTAADTKTSHVKVTGNIFNGTTNQPVRATSGFLSNEISGNKFVLLEGYAAADGPIEIGGGGSGVAGFVALNVHDNELVYAGTTSVTGTKNFVNSSISGGTGTRGGVRNNTFPTTIFSKALGGNFITPLIGVSGNSSNTTDAGARSGTFTCGAVNDFSIAALVTASSILTLTPTNQAAGTLQSSTAMLVHYTNVVGTGFFLKTASGAACAGTETFEWFLTEP